MLLSRSLSRSRSSFSRSSFSSFRCPPRLDGRPAPLGDAAEPQQAHQSVALLLCGATDEIEGTGKIRTVEAILAASALSGQES
eukprot:3047687-Rhodomonas_salina.1